MIFQCNDTHYTDYPLFGEGLKNERQRSRSPLARSLARRATLQTRKGDVALHAVAPRGRRCSHEVRRRGGGATQEGGEQEAHSIRSEIDSGGRTKRDRDATAKDKVGTGGAAREECRELLAVGRPAGPGPGELGTDLGNKERTGNGPSGFADGWTDRRSDGQNRMEGELLWYVLGEQFS